MRRSQWISGIAYWLTVPILLGACPSNGGQRNAKLAQTHFLLGSDYVKKKMPDAAKRELMRSIELEPAHKDAHQLLGVIFFFEGMNKVNILERQQCLKGAAAKEQREEANKDFRRCEEHLLEAVRLAKKNKTNSEALNYLANVSLHFKRYDEAITLAERALSNILYASRHLALGTLGWAYFHRGKYDKAARELRQSVFHEPKFCVGRYRLAKVYYHKAQYNQALAELQKVVDDKTCPIQEAHHLLGLTLMKLKKPEQAKVEFDACVKLNPKSCISEECRHYAKLI